MKAAGRGAIVAAVLLIAALLTDVLVPGVWSSHAMVTNLVSSAIVVVVTLTVINNVTRFQENDRRRDLVNLAYTAAARGPRGQQRVMWFLVSGGDSPDDSNDFHINKRSRAKLREIFYELGIQEVDEQRVREIAARPDIEENLRRLCENATWIELARELIRDSVHGFRAIIARWATVLLQADENVVRALSVQANELVEVNRQLFRMALENRGSYLEGDQIKSLVELWLQTFANAVVLDEAMIKCSGNPPASWKNSTSPARRLLSADDLEHLQAKSATTAPNSPFKPLYSLNEDDGPY